MDGRQGEIGRQRRSGGARVDPGQLEGHQRQGQILGAFDEAALMRVHEQRREAGLVEGGEQVIFLVGPFVRVAGALGHEFGHHGTRYGAGGLDRHLEVEAVGETPHDLADVVSRKRTQCIHKISFLRLG